MEIFPQNIFVSGTLPKKTMFKTLITAFETGKEQRRKKWAFPRREFGLNYKRVVRGSFKDIWKFYHERSGAYEAFWLIDPSFDYWYGEFLGYGNGTQTYFDLKSVSTDQETLTVSVYVDGVSSAFTFVSGSGQGGCDRVIMGVAPETGTIVTADFYGKLRIPARFLQDELTRELAEYLFYNSQIPVIEDKSIL